MKALSVGVVLVLVFGWTVLSFACENCGCQVAKAGQVHEPAAVEGVPVAAVSDAKAVAAAPVLVNAGNTICPIMGGAVSVDSPNKVEYKGKLYNLCCGGCKEAFLKDPEAALKKLAELEAAAKVKK
jgi:YHS domain-containing protein